jgi:hypothetical protein
MIDIKWFILMLIIFWIGNFLSLLLLYPVALLDDGHNTTSSTHGHSNWRLDADDQASVDHTFGSPFRTFFGSMNMVRFVRCGIHPRTRSWSSLCTHFETIGYCCRAQMFGQFDLEMIDMALSP